MNNVNAMPPPKVKLGKRKNPRPDLEIKIEKVIEEVVMDP